MANIKDWAVGGGGQTAQVRMFRDQGDGSFSVDESALLYGWDPNGLQWTRLQVDSNGLLRISTAPSAAIQNAVIDTASSGDNTIVSADATHKIKVVSYVIVASSAVAVRWKSGSTSKSGAMSLASNGGVSASGISGAPLFETAVNNALVLNLGGAVQVSGHLAYFLEA